MNSLDTTYKKIIQFFGEQNQKELAIKLLKELICEIEVAEEEGVNKARMITVLANAQNMLNQLKIMYEINPTKVAIEMNQKNDETLRYIQEELERVAETYKGTDL